ncbi:hypothetical protein BJY52DRAFT_1220462 [Lactarius psammicola]|nr:hypothetical protein BJY52DRAFT_1220462 [Lactarius psammicola]
MDKIVAAHSPGDSLTPTQINTIRLIQLLVASRLNTYLSPKHLEDTIHRFRTLLCLPSLPDQDRTRLAVALGKYERQRLSYFGVTGNLRETSPDTSDPLFSYDILQIPGPTSQIPDPAPQILIETADHLKEILTAIRNDETTDVEAAVERSRTLRPLHSSDRLSSLPASIFAKIFFQVHQPTNRLDCINEAITACRDLQIEKRGVPSDYASYQIKTVQFKQAVETPERGRALLWSEMRSLRTTADQRRAAVPASADKLADINWRFESVTMAVAQSEGEEIGERNWNWRREGTDSIGRLVAMQRRLLGERETLISHIQSFPSFKNFLKPPLFDVLNSAAVHGPVIITNQSRFPSCIIFLLKDSPPSVISTPPNFHDRAYELVGKPVTERLRQLEVPEKYRVWWCPTNAFCSLPLHAMGPIPSDDSNKVYFMDLYIPSYTPVLSALIESSNPGSQPETFENPSLLLVAQPETLPGAWGEINVLKVIGSPVTTLVLEKATPHHGCEPQGSLIRSFCRFDTELSHKGEEMTHTCCTLKCVIATIKRVTSTRSHAAWHQLIPNLHLTVIAPLLTSALVSIKYAHRIFDRKPTRHQFPNVAQEKDGRSLWRHTSEWVISGAAAGDGQHGVEENALATAVSA